MTLALAAAVKNTNIATVGSNDSLSLVALAPLLLKCRNGAIFYCRRISFNPFYLQKKSGDLIKFSGHPVCIAPGPLYMPSGQT